MLVYRTFLGTKKYTVKLIHAVLNFLAWFTALFGLKGVYDHKEADDPPIPHYYSLHSWLGLFVIIGFAFQWMFGLLFYLCSSMPQKLRAWAMPYHRRVGIALYLLIAAVTVSGLTEKAYFAMKNYHESPPEATLVNLIGVFTAVQTALFVYLIQKESFQRPPEDPINRN